MKEFPSVSDDGVYDTSRPNVRRSMALLALGALVGLAIAGYGLFTAKGTRSRSVPPEAVALVNQRPVLRSDFMTQAQVQFAVPYDELTVEQRAATLEDMLAEELRMQRGLEIDLPSYDPDVRSALVAGVELEVAADVLAQQPTDEQLHAFYEANKGKYSSEGVLRLRDLVVSEDESRNHKEALAVAASAILALRGGTPLATVIQQYRLKDSGRLTNAGKVDIDDIFEFAVQAKFTPKLFEALKPLNAGQVSEPVEEADGAHLIYVMARRRPLAQGFDAAKNSVWSDYKAAAQARVNKGNLEYLRNRADILIAPEYVDAEVKARAKL
jgi:parvulin-like peptidyl-prolyl isomerase